jgi:16S rRNA (cytosine1402-N4)-methyltransferase
MEKPTTHNNSQDFYHTPVLLNEVVEGLHIQPNGVYVDCTFGGGGHSKAILERLNEQGKLIAFDQDPDAEKNVPINDKRFLFISENFRHLQRFLKWHQIFEVDGILADLGVSSHQINEASRGFSTRFNGPLDMRMNPNLPRTAATILNTYSEQQLQQMFQNYGEVTNAKTLSHYIVQHRTPTSLHSVESFKTLMAPVVKGNPHKYFAQVFQALRIEVNDEMGALKELLQQAVSVLKTGGRIAIITFHSIEDRIVKHFFKSEQFEPLHENVFQQPKKPSLKTITKKPITPSKEEVKQNPRSRSAKLRIAEKI